MASAVQPRARTVAEPLAPGTTPQRVRAIWALAWPVILAFSLESIVGLCDALMVGRLGAAPTAAVGLGIHVLSAVNLGMFAVGTGALAIVSRHIGAGERHAAEHALTQAILAALGLSVLVAVPVMLATPQLVALFQVAPDVATQATPFVRVIMLAVPADAVVFTIAASLRAAGDTRTPLAVGIVVGVANVAIAWVLIFGRFGFPALGVLGAAVATVTAFALGAVLGVGLLARGDLGLRLRWGGRRLDAAAIRRLLRVGYPAAVEHLLMQAGFLAYMAFAARYGTAAVAAYFIGVRILALAFLPGFGFGAAAGTLVGQALGARRPAEAARSGWLATGLAIALMTTGSLALLAFARPIARLFVDDDAVVDAAVSFIRMLALAQPLMAIDFTLGGALRGAADTRLPLVAALVGFYGVRLGLSVLVALVLHLDLVWLWATLLGDYLVRAALKIWRFRSGRWAELRV